MNNQTITLGDGTVVLLTYDANGKVLTISSLNPVFALIVGDLSLNIGTFTDNVINTVADLFNIIGGTI